MKRLLHILLLGAIALGGCGGDSVQEEESTGGEEIGPHDRRHVGDEHEYADHPEMAPALEEFHYAFSLYWHGDHAPSDVCPDMERLQGLAGAASDEHEDEAVSEELRASTQAVADACTGDQSEYNHAFDRMHHALHAMMGVPLE